MGVGNLKAPPQRLASNLCLPTAHPYAQAGALAGFLKELLMQDVPYVQHLEQDFAECLAIHFQVRQQSLLA